MKIKKLLATLLSMILVISLTGIIPVSAKSKKSVKLNKTEITLLEEETVTLKLTNVSKNKRKNIDWASMDKTVATVNKNGKVKGISEGNTVIYAFYKNKAYTCNITVMKNIGTVYMEFPERWTMMSTGEQVKAGQLILKYPDYKGEEYGLSIFNQTFEDEDTITALQEFYKAAPSKEILDEIKKQVEGVGYKVTGEIKLANRKPNPEYNIYTCHIKDEDGHIITYYTTMYNTFHMSALLISASGKQPDNGMENQIALIFSEAYWHKI